LSLRVHDVPDRLPNHPWAMQNRSVHQAENTVLVTGAAGHVGEQLCRLLRSQNKPLIATDVDDQIASDAGVATFGPAILACDLRQPGQIRKLFAQHPIATVIHLAAVLPTAFRADPVGSAELNLAASVDLLKAAVDAGVRRFIFASSMSVYGSLLSPRPLTELDPAAPNDPYGAAKRAIELIGEALAGNRQIEFVALRIARVVGPGIKKSSSPWRSQIFERNLHAPIQIPFAPDAKLSLVHVHDVAQMLATLANAEAMKQSIYNAPAEILDAVQLKALVERATGNYVELGPPGAHAGPTCDGSRFAEEHGFQVRGLDAYLSSSAVD
jgi:nucleoside-diphosphate-sugar epimerase